MAIYFVGHIAYDTLIYVRKFPHLNSATEAHAVFDVFGGGAANCSLIAANLGAKAELVSVAGQDFANSGYKQHLSSHGIGLKHVKILKGEMTSRAFMPIDAEGNQISYFFWGASAKFQKLAPPKLHLKQGDILHIVAGAPKFNRQLIAAHSKAFISFDPAYDVVLYSKADMEHILKRVRLLFVNEHELKNILIKVGEKSANDLLAYGPAAVIVTEGARGCAVSTKKGHFHVKAYEKAKPVDPTGAGDAYRAAFLAALSKGRDLKECAKIANSVASFVIEKPGAQTNAPTWEMALKRAKGL